MQTGNDLSNDPRWEMASKIEDLITKITSIRESLNVITDHTLHYDPMDPSLSLDSIFDEARKSGKTVEQFRQLLSASWVAIVAQINGIPVQLPMTPEEVEELRQRLERK